MTGKIKGLEEVFAKYEGFILDLWGVVHDGIRPFPGTIPTLELLKKAKRKVWLLSNAPRRAEAVAAALDQDMGISPSLYSGILTSGEATWQALREELIEEWGRRCLYIGMPGRDDGVYEGLGLEIVRDPAKADFILCTGVENPSDTGDKYVDLLRACARQQLPFLCANPDKLVHVGNELVVCPGTLAEIYAGMDGEVVYQGKPHREVYARVLRAMGTRNVLAVGDGMLTDIAGAVAAGLDSALVTSGLHREEFSSDDPETFLSGYPYRPRYWLERLSW